jgi:hypothetical protein
MTGTRTEKTTVGESRTLGQWKRTYQRYFAAGFIIAVLVHVLVTYLYQTATEQPAREVSVTVEKPEYDLVQPPVKFELRAPRLAKSFSVTKTPSYVSSFTPREIKFEPTQATRVEQTPSVTSARPGSGKPSQFEGSIFYGALTGAASAEASWGIPGGAVAFGRSLGTGGKLGWGEGQTAGVDFTPDLSDDVANTRTGGMGLATMRDELVDYSNFSDRFEGWVEQDPRNKKKVSGTLNFYQLRWRASKSEPNGEEGWNAFPRALPTLVEYARESTSVRINLSGNIRLDDRQLLTVPILYMMGFSAAVQYTEQESKNLGKWLRQGGFLFIDDGYAAQYGAFNKSSRQLLKDALGYDAEFERIAKNHWLYHCWDDFDGPPSGLDDSNLPVVPARINERYPYLEGIFLAGRLVVLVSNKGYSHAWGQWRFVPPAQGGPLDNTRQLHFGINIIVFASTMKGGIIDQNKAKVASENQRK